MKSKMTNGCLVLLATVGILSLFSATTSASAQVTFFGAQKTQFYSQTTDDTAPATPGSFSEYGFADTTSSGDANSFTLSDTSNSTNPDSTIILTSTTDAPTSFVGNKFFNTKADLDAAFTEGDDYTFTAQGGNLDGESEILPIPDDSYPAIVYLTGTNLTDATHVSPNADFTFDIGYSGDNSGATGLNFSLEDSAGNGVPGFAANGLPVGTTSYTLSQSQIDSLVPGEIYTASFSNFETLTETPSGNFGDAFYSDAFINTSSFDFEVIPEPNQITLLFAGLLMLAGAVRFRGLKLKA
jgi:hypothetical protein